MSRAGLKLAYALKRFDVRCAGLVCADLGSQVGGFVDCLLQHGASRVYAVDTCYGTLAWKLRRDQQVVVMERTNALHVQLPQLVDLVTVDVGWTRQAVILPHAKTLCKLDGRIITLIKLQYEAMPNQLDAGVVQKDDRSVVLTSVVERIDDLGMRVVNLADSPISGRGGNLEVLALLSLD